MLDIRPLVHSMKRIAVWLVIIHKPNEFVAFLSAVEIPHLHA